MSRSGYTEDDDDGMLALYRGQVASATRGKRGQKMLVDLLAALDAMPQKRLIANDFQAQGEVCALGALGQTRGIDLTDLDPEYDYYGVRVLAQRFDVAQQLAREVVYMNDEAAWPRHSETPEQRWERMRNWVDSQIIRTPK